MLYELQTVPNSFEGVLSLHLIKSRHTGIRLPGPAPSPFPDPHFRGGRLASVIASSLRHAFRSEIVFHNGIR